MSLSHSVTGTGSPVVILHGLLGAGRNWAPIAKRLADHHRVFALDLRNHGDSFWDDDVSYEAMADDVRRFMIAHGLRGATVLGHSMGGKVAMTLALAQGPELVGRLVVADIAPVSYKPGFLKLLRAMKAVKPAAFSRRAEVDALLSVEVPDQRLRGFLMSNLEKGDQGYRWKVNLEALIDGHQSVAGFPDLQGHRYDGGALFVFGELSDYVLAEHQPLIATLFPQVHYAVVAQAGHWLHAEHPDGFMAAVDGFL